MTKEDDGFLSRWSRRKRGASTEEAETTAQTPAERHEPAISEAPQPVTEINQAPLPETEESEEEILERLGLPDPATLGKGDDFKPFMQAAVPEFLRRKALRQLWRSNPTLAVLDGLNDYDDDFSGGFVAPGTLKTVYEVGKGLVVPEDEEKVEPEPVEEQPRAEDDGDAPTHPDHEEEQAPEMEGEDTPNTAALPQDIETEHADAATPTRKRMSFTFDS